MGTARIVLFDVETSHMLAAIFGLFNENISHKNIVQDWFMPCAAWKVLGEKKTHAVSVLDDQKRFKANPRDDEHVIRILHKVLSEADIVVAHNGDGFDIKRFNTRALLLGLPPIPPIKTVDTLKVAKTYFGFPSNRLDYIAKALKVGGKIETREGLWLDVLKGDAQAIKDMVKYNKVDVDILERVYLKLRPYMRRHPNVNLGETKDHPIGCPCCSSTDLSKRGYAYATASKRQRYNCNECGTWTVGPILQK